MTVFEVAILAIVGATVLWTAAWTINLYLKYIRLVRLLRTYNIRAYKRIRRFP